jgi:hypothetical protein
MLRSKTLLMGMGVGLIVGAVVLQLGSIGQTIAHPTQPVTKFAFMVSPNADIETLSWALVDLGVLEQRQTFVKKMTENKTWKKAKKTKHYVFDRAPSVDALVQKLNE